MMFQKHTVKLGLLGIALFAAVSMFAIGSITSCVPMKSPKTPDHIQQDQEQLNDLRFDLKQQ